MIHKLQGYSTESSNDIGIYLFSSISHYRNVYKFFVQIFEYISFSGNSIIT